MTTQGSDSATFARPTISAAGAGAILRAAEMKAREIGVPVVITVVDESGSLKAFLRMDGTPPGATRWSVDKARTAASFRAPTHVLDETMRNAPASATASFIAQPHATLAPGGFPLAVDAGVVGGIGASGGSPDQDQLVAEAGLAALR